MLNLIKRKILPFKENGMCDNVYDRLSHTKSVEEAYKVLTHPHCFEYLFDNWGADWFLKKNDLNRLFSQYLNTYKNNDTNSIAYLNYTGGFLSNAKIYLFIDSYASIRLFNMEIIYVYSINSHLNFTGVGGVILMNKGEVGFVGDNVNVKIIK